MEINFSGKRALVTGAGQGIGRGIALKLAKCGATVIALDISTPLLEKLKEEIPSLIYKNVDLSDWKATEDTIKTLFPIDLLVNNAGIAIIEPLTTISEDQFDRTFSLNIKAVINVTRLVIQDLLNRGSPGAIVSISSIASLSGLLNQTIYCASKGGIDGFTRAVASEYGPQKIRINAVNPTVVNTELGIRIWGASEKTAIMLDRIPLKKFAEIENVVDTVLFLLSDKADMITGSCLPVDGGFLAGGI